MANSPQSENAKIESIEIRTLAYCQRKLDTICDESAYWDSHEGLFVLRLAAEFGLEPTTTNAERQLLSGFSD